jgi:hypothetical protein
VTRGLLPRLRLSRPNTEQMGPRDISLLILHQQQWVAKHHPLLFNSIHTVDPILSQVLLYHPASPILLIKHLKQLKTLQTSLPAIILMRIGQLSVNLQLLLQRSLLYNLCNTHGLGRLNPDTRSNILPSCHRIKQARSCNTINQYPILQHRPTKAELIFHR